MATKTVRILQRVGDPGSGMILAPGASVELPEVWADRYIANGSAELIEAKTAKVLELEAIATGKTKAAKKGK